MKKLYSLIVILLFTMAVTNTAIAQPGSIDPSFNPGTGVNNFVTTTAIQSDGKIIIVGTFTSYDGTSRNSIARLNADGTLDGTFNPGTGANNFIEQTAIQNDGKIIIAGDFTSYNGTARNRIARLNPDGTLDGTFNPGTGANINVTETNIQSDGKIIIVGYFTFYNGTARNRIARLNADGSLDLTFNPGAGANSFVQATAIQSDGKIIIGGGFTSYNGTPRNFIARLYSDGTLDLTFNPGTGANVLVRATAIQSDGKIIIGGDFTSYNGTARNYIARLNTDGTLDGTFNPGTGANNAIPTTAIQGDGKIIIVGLFTCYNGTSRNRIARLNADGTLDVTFNPGAGANNFVRAIAIQSDGKIIIGGTFTSYNGTGRNRIARILVGECTTPPAPSVTSPVTYCQFATPVALTATGTNLLWYTAATCGTGSATAPIPNTSQPGTTIFYVSQTVNNCESPMAQISVIVNVNALPTIICPPSSCVFIDAAAFALSAGSPTGGTYSGTGVSAGMFTPATAGVGVHAITYTYTDGNCSSSCTFTITVNASPIIPVISGTLCAAGSTLTVSPTNGIASLTWSLNGTPVSTVSSVLTVAGGNGPGSNANQLQNPYGVFVDGSNNVFIGDLNNHRVQRWAPGASTGTTVAGGNGAGANANQLSNTRGVYVDGSGNVYVTDRNNHRIQRWAPGATIGITVAGGNGPGVNANQLSFPNGVYVDVSGNVYVADRSNNRIQRWAPGASSGTTVAGGTGAGANANQFNFPSGVYVDGSGNVYVADGNNHRIQRWAPGATSGTTVAGGNGQGVNLNQLNQPTGVYLDGSDNVYIADFSNDRIQRWVPGATSGITVAGGNGRGANANQLAAPSGVYVDGSANVYVADQGNHRIQLFNNSINNSLPNSVVGTYMVTVTGITGCSVSSAPVTVGDNQPPATPTLADVNVGECSGTPTAPTTTDNCAGTITGSTTTVFPITTQGTTVVTWTFDDGNGNSTTANQNVIINDVTNPVITCPANTVIQYGNDESPAANGTATATDNCTGVSVSIPTDATVNGPGNNKTITRTWTATDVANNTATCNQTITVCDLGVSLGNNRFVFYGITGLPGTSGIITATTSGGLTGITYAWAATSGSFAVNGSGDSITPSGYTDAQAVTYTVTATAPNGCTATTSVTITYFNINCSTNGNTVKVKVCHIPQGNPTNCKTICVSINAYQTLLDNGSYLGNCLPNCEEPPQPGAANNSRAVPDISKYIVGKQTLDVKVFSNPSRTFFRLYVYGEFYQKVSLRVMDLHGRVIDQKNNLNTEQEIRIGDSYIAGVYMVEVMQGSNRKVVKLVKQ